jgi:hypothetical protein
MKRDLGFVGAASSRDELFETAFHVPLGHPETMKRRVGWAKRQRSPPKLFITGSIGSKIISNTRVGTGYGSLSTARHESKFPE